MHRLILLFLLFISASANSATYEWRVDGVFGTFPTPTSACQAWITKINSTRPPGATYTLGSVTRTGPTQFRCPLMFNGSEVAGAAEIAKRQGDTCPADKPQLNSDTGECEVIPPPTCNTPGQVWDPAIGFCVTPDPCAAKSGQSTGFKISGNQNQPNAFYKPVGNTFVTPNFVTSGPAGCNAVVQPGVKCRVFGNGDFTCKGNATYDGQKPSPGDSSPPPTDPCANEEDCAVPPPDPTNTNSNSCSNWVYDAEGRRTRTCESSTTTTQPGTGSCLTNGSLVCVKPSPTPVTKTTSTSSNQNQTTDPATGNTTTTTGDTITTTICKAGACNTTTTTNNTVVVKNPSGDTIGQSGNCTGPGCASNTNPDADGDGLGDCLKNCGDEEQPEEGSATHSESCDVPPPCDGDPFQCALLLQAHYNSCKEREPFTPEQQEEVDETIDAAYAANEEAQQELDGQVSGFFSEFKAKATGNSQNGSGTCLADKTFSFMGQTISLPFSMVCPFIVFFRMALIAMAYLFSARIIATQV